MCVIAEIYKGVWRMEDFVGLIAVVMGLSIPLSAVVLNHVRGNQNLKAKMLKDELELERLKHENFVAETEKMRLELQQMQLTYAKSADPVVSELQKEQVKALT